jgi:cofilin
VLFCLSEDKKNFTLEKDKEILVGDVDYTVDTPIPPLSRCCQTRTVDVPSVMQPTSPRRTRRRTWCSSPGHECAPLKSKIIYSDNKDAIKKKLTGIKHELQANCYEKVKDCCTLAEKLGEGGSAIISLESKPL